EDERVSQSGAEAALKPGPAPARLFIVQHGLQDYHSHYYGETRGWQAACRARNIEPRFYINQRAPAEMVREFEAQPVFPFASDVIVERDPECRQLADFLMLGNRFARAARALEADGLAGSDLVLVPFSTERDIFGAAIWLQRLAPERRPTLG